MPPSRAARRPPSSSSGARERGSLLEQPRLPAAPADTPPIAPHAQQRSERDAAAGDHAVTLLCGPPGSGKTEQLVARALDVLGDATEGEQVLLLAPSREAVAALAARFAERAGDVGKQAPSPLSAQAFCERLLRREAACAGLDPFFVVANRAERLWLLLARAREAPSESGRAAGELRAHALATPAAALRAVAHVDRLKAARVDAQRYARWANALAADDARARAAVSFASVYREHERALAERGALDEGDVLLRALELLAQSPVRTRLARLHRHLLVDDVDDSSPALLSLIELLGDAIPEVTLAADEHADAALASNRPGARVVSLQTSVRCTAAMLAAARGALDESVLDTPAAGTSAAPAGPPPTDTRDHDGVVFWRCADERAEAHVVVGEVERLITRGGSEEELSIGVLVRSLQREGRAVVGALKERAIPCRVPAGSELFESSQVRDLLAWLRLLIDPLDRNATIRLLMRPPVELRPVELARVVQLSRRRKLDMPAALAAALEAPQLPPEARERIAGFLEVYGELAGELEDLRPEELVHRLIARSGLRSLHALGTAEDALEGLLGLSRVEELAAHFSLLMPHAAARELASHLCAAAEVGLALEDLIAADAAARRQGPGALVEVRAMDSARGCQYDHVFVTGLDSDLVDAAPKHGASGTRASDQLVGELAGEHAPPGWPHGLRRTVYIALTRARRGVVLLYAARDGARAARSPLAAAEDARRALGERWADREPPHDATQALHAAARMVRQQLLEDATRIGGRLGELRLDTGEDISYGVVRYLELLKLVALLERPRGQTVAETLPDLNARLLAACTPLQRELLGASGLDAALAAADATVAPDASGPLAAGPQTSAVAALREVLATPEDARLAAFLPRHGRGLVLSASDIESYRACPLRYKFARVLRVPADPTPQQRFGIMVHKVLERYHSEWDSGADEGNALPTLMRLLDAAWRRAGFRESSAELSLRERVRAALARYHRQLADDPGRPVWFERSFAFSVGPDLVRGRVDRVDRIGEDAYELIDYKTGHARTPAQLEGDIQLALYALAAKRAWDVTAERLAYYYVLDNRKVPLATKPDGRLLRSVEATVAGVAEGIRALSFAPTPSYAVCSGCDFLSICPAAET